MKCNKFGRYLSQIISVRYDPSAEYTDTQEHDGWQCNTNNSYTSSFKAAYTSRLRPHTLVA